MRTSSGLWVFLLPSVAFAQSASPAAVTSRPTIAWTWDGPAPGFGRFPSQRSVSDGQGGACQFIYDETARTARFQCNDAHANPRWSTVVDTRAFVADAALLVVGRTLYAARFSDISTGAQMLALDVATGREVWRTALQGIGPVAHSEYLNSVQLRWMDGALVVFGWESAGRYIETVEPTTGHTMSNVRLPAR